jgi:hypothetical protein
MNPFELFGILMTAHLENESSIKERYQLLTKQKPEDSADLNRAYQLLLSPGQRLKCLLEQRFGQAFTLKGPVPNSLIELFSKVGEATQAADIVIAKKSKASTALAEAILAPSQLDVQKVIGVVMVSVNREWESCLQQLSKVDEGLLTENPDTLLYGATLCRKLIYLEKWRQQLQICIHALI